MSLSGRPRFSWRTLTSLAMAFAFLMLAVSGVMLFLAPSTRIARDTGWQMWGLTKTGWQDLHIVFSALFLIVAVIHTVFNWRPLLNYLEVRVSEHRGIRWEWLVALLLSALAWLGTRREMPPFAWLLDWRQKFHGGLCAISSPAEDFTAKGQAGFGRKTLAQYCADRGLNLDAALLRLNARGIKASGADTLRRIADANGYDRPSDIIRLLQP